ncbi:microtubule-associated protein futsch [Anabrus simplex]|uniref:microtubule-associated protein futsch n=1 Tax=Anabrus simplex TaxID=316456 RepID=UPI0035A32A71
MSINVTVHGSPMKMCKRKWLLADVERLRKEEIDRRRKLRLQQVREQSRIIADQVRRRFKEEKQRLQNLHKKHETAMQRKRAAAELEELQKKYRECMEDIGMGHKYAALEPDAEEVLDAERKRWRSKALLRGQIAAEQLRAEETQARRERDAAERQREFKRTIEELRSTMVASLAKKKKSINRSPSEGREATRHRKPPAMHTRSRSSEQLPHRERVPAFIPRLHGIASGESESSSQKSETAEAPQTIAEAPRIIDDAAVLSTTGTSKSAEEESRMLKRAWIKEKAEELRGVINDNPDILEETLERCRAACAEELEDRQRRSRRIAFLTEPSEEESSSTPARVEELSLSDSEVSIRPNRVKVRSHVCRSRNYKDSKPEEESADDSDLVDKLIPSLRAFRELIARSRKVLSQDEEPKPRSDPVVTFNPVVCYSSNAAVAGDTPGQDVPALVHIPAAADPKVSYVPTIRSSRSSSPIPSTAASVPCSHTSTEVKFYDHSNRFERTYLPTDLVEKISSHGQVDACHMAEEESTFNELSSSRTVASVARADTLGQRALFKERIRRDYRYLLNKLSDLAREERRVRAGLATSLPTDVHHSNERHREKRCRRQKTMDSAFEKVLHSTKADDATPRVQFGGADQVRSPVDSQTPAKLNVGDWAPAENVEASPDGSIILGERPPSPRETALRRLMERIQVQRTLLKDELEHGKQTQLSKTAADQDELQHGKQARLSKTAIDQEELHDSTSSSSSTVSCPELPVRPDRKPRHRHHHHRHHKARRKEEQQVVAESAPVSTQDVLDKARRVLQESRQQALQLEDLQEDGSPPVVSVDMSMSRMEHSILSTDGSSVHTNSSVTTYEGVKIIVSVCEKPADRLEDDVQVKKIGHKLHCKKKRAQGRTTVDVATSPVVVEQAGGKKEKPDTHVCSTCKCALHSTVKVPKQKEMVASASVQTVQSTGSQTTPRGSPSHVRKWGDALEETSSTTYMSPPDQLSGSIDMETLVRLLNSRRQPHKNVELNPYLMLYISRLLMMSSESVAELNVSCSDISSFSTDVVEQSSNAGPPTPAQQVRKPVCKKKQAQRNVRSVGTVVSPSVFDGTNETGATEYASPPDTLRDVCQRLVRDVAVEAHLDNPPVGEVFNSTNGMYNVPVVERPVRDVGLLLNDLERRNVLLDMQYAPHRVSEDALRGGGYAESPSEPGTARSQEAKTDAKPVPVDISEGCQKCCGACRCQHPDDRFPDVCTEFESLTERCTRRITDLAQMIDNVRREKRQLLDPTSDDVHIVVPDEIKNTSETARSKPPPSLWRSSARAGIHISKPHELSTIIEVDTPQKLKGDSVLSDGTPQKVEEEQQSPDIMAELVRRNILHSPFKWMKKMEHSQVEQPDTGVTDLLRSSTMLKDQASFAQVESTAKSTQADVATSTGVTLCSQMDSAAKSTQVDMEMSTGSQTKGSSNVGFFHSEEDASTPVSRLVKFRSAQAASKDRVSTVIQSTSERKESAEIQSKGVFLSSENSKHVSQESTASEAKEAHLPPLHINSTDSSPEDLESTFKRLGIGWASAMLRKTQEALAMSSSSSDYSPQRRSRHQKLWPSSKPSPDSMDDSHDDSFPQRVRDHSTPLILSDTNSKIDSNKGKHHVSFTAESEISTVQQSSPTDNSDLSIKTPNVSLRIRTHSSSHSSKSSS